MNGSNDRVIGSLACIPIGTIFSAITNSLTCMYSTDARSRWGRMMVEEIKERLKFNGV
jgi:hypothetical protein